MDYNRHTSRLLHDDHLATIAIVNRLEESFLRLDRKTPPAGDDQEFQSLLGDVAMIFENETGRHFDFEETHLFPLLLDNGEMGIVVVLKSEHTAIRPLATELAELAKKGRGEAFSNDEWQRFLDLVAELSERQISHIQKETMALLPMLDAMLDEDMDGELSMAYASM